jgi:hypothetical protein
LRHQSGVAHTWQGHVEESKKQEEKREGDGGEIRLKILVLLHENQTYLLL